MINIFKMILYFIFGIIILLILSYFIYRTKALNDDERYFFIYPKEVLTDIRSVRRWLDTEICPLNEKTNYPNPFNCQQYFECAYVNNVWANYVRNCSPIDGFKYSGINNCTNYVNSDCFLNQF